MGLDYRTSTGLGRKESLEGHKQNLVCTRTQEKGTVTPKETESYLPVSVQWRSLQWRHGSTVACHGVRGTDDNSPGRHSMPTLSLLKEITIGLRPNYRKGTEPYPLVRKLD